MREYYIGIYNNDVMETVLGAEEDNEELWNEAGETEFESRVLSNLKLEIDNNRYIYTVSGTNDIGITLIVNNMSSNVIPLGKVIGELSSIEDDDTIKVLTRANNEVCLIVNGSTLLIRETKLISFRDSKVILQILMVH